MASILRPDDDRFHKRTDDPHWNESGWFSVLHPEQDLSGWVYMYHRPNMYLSAGGVALWDPTGEHGYDCVFHRYDEHEALPEGADMYDFSLANGLSVATKELQRSYDLSYKSEGCELQLNWTAFMDPVLVGAQKEDVLEDWGAYNYTQGGRMTGTIHTDGGTYEIDSVSMRDHSWGPRRTKPYYPRGAAPWAIGPETSFLLWTINILPPDQDPYFGTTETNLPNYGWYRRGGEAHTIVEAASRVDRGKDGRPLGLILDAVDEAGNELHAEGRVHNMIRWYGHVTGDLYMNWCLAGWDFDGQQAWGEIQDYSMLQTQRRILRSLPRR